MIFWKRWSHGLGWVRLDISKCKAIGWPKYRLKWHSFRSSITSTSATTRSLLSSRQALSTSQWPLSLTSVWKTIASSLFKTEPFKVVLYCNNNAFVIMSWMDGPTHTLLRWVYRWLELERFDPFYTGCLSKDAWTDGALLQHWARLRRHWWQ